MKIQRGLGILGVLFLFLFAGVASAQEIEIPLFSSLVSSTPIFGEGQIIGFSYEQDYLIGEPKVKIATETGVVLLPDGQVFNPSTEVMEAQVTGTVTVPEVGNFSFKGTMIALGGPSAASTGDLVVSWVQSYFDGTDFLAGFYGLGSGTGKINLFTNVGENAFKMILMAPVSE